MYCREFTGRKQDKIKLQSKTEFDKAIELLDSLGFKDSYDSNTTYVFGRGLTEEEYNVLFNSVEHLPNSLLEGLLKKLNDTLHLDYSVVDDL